MTWKTDVRRWAREQGATHALLHDGRSGRRPRATIETVIRRIEKAWPSAARARTVQSGTHNQAVIHTPTGETVAIVYHPTRREPDGHDREGRQLWRHIDCGEPS